MLDESSLVSTRQVHEFVNRLHPNDGALLVVYPCSQLYGSRRGLTPYHSDRQRIGTKCLVISVTAFSSKSGEDLVNTIARTCLMSDNLGNSNARLEKLVRQIMKEKDPVKFDALCAELWRVLDERESLTSIENEVGGASTTAA